MFLNMDFLSGTQVSSSDVRNGLDFQMQFRAKSELKGISHTGNY